MTAVPTHAKKWNKKMSAVCFCVCTYDPCTLFSSSLSTHQDHLVTDTERKPRTISKGREPPDAERKFGSASVHSSLLKRSWTSDTKIEKKSSQRKLCEEKLFPLEKKGKDGFYSMCVPLCSFFLYDDGAQLFAAATFLGWSKECCCCLCVLTALGSITVDAIAKKLFQVLLLHEFERVALQKLALQKLNKNDLGITIRLPKGRKVVIVKVYNVKGRNCIYPGVTSLQIKLVERKEELQFIHTSIRKLDLRT